MLPNDGHHPALMLAQPLHSTTWRHTIIELHMMDTNDGLLSTVRDDIYDTHIVHENRFMAFGIRYMLNRIYKIYDV